MHKNLREKEEEENQHQKEVWHTLADFNEQDEEYFELSLSYSVKLNSNPAVP